jgi:superfamily II DNA/RNA helicase
MGKRRRKGGKKDGGDGGGNSSSVTTTTEGIVYKLEDDASASTSDAQNVLPEWSIDYVPNINTSASALASKSEAAPSFKDISDCMVKGTLDRIQSKKNKSKRKSNESTSNVTVTPTPIQLRMWPAMLESFQALIGESKSLHNIHALAATGTGKTLGYAIPIMVHSVWKLLCQKQPHKGISVHGLVLAPTRELVIQVSKEIKVVAKTANKLLSKFSKTACESNSVEAIAIYGGVDAQSQISSLQGGDDGDSSLVVSKSLIVAATPGRLQDLLNKDDTTTTSADSTEAKSQSVVSAFDNLQTIVFDEADRIALNPEMAAQVDDILDILKKQRKEKNILSCLVSATLPERAVEVCNKWVPRSRYVVKIDSVKFGKEAPAKEDADVTNNEDDGDNSTRIEAAARNSNINIDLASIPSHLVQTCHVCSNHKKAKKLILTLSRLYKNPNNAQSSGRFTSNNRLCIVFFAQIKTVKYASKMLQKEGLRCVELYGSLHQSEREKRLLDFRAGKTPILLATDVAARGIHINNVHYVINYDFPGSLDQYVHRCGRAGRKQLLSGEDVSSNPPTVYSFFTREFAAMADSVIELLRSCKAAVDPNLLALSSSNKPDAAKSTKRRKRKADAMSEAENRSVEDDDDESDKDDFQYLGKSVLKRASHVSDAEDDSESD